MSRLALLGRAGGRHREVVPPIPYEFPTTTPFNVPIYAPTPTPDGTGVALHPDVVIFPGSWNGHRFWMAVTPLTSDPEENPCILVSDNGWGWSVPAGLTNPIDPWPGAGIGAGYWYNSDTDMIYDPATDELVVIWREVKTGSWEYLWMSHSSDGITWAEPVKVLENVDGTPDWMQSPSIIKVADDDWRIAGIGANGVTDHMWFATAREGPYTDPQPMTFTTLLGGSWNPYHGDFRYEGPGQWVGIGHTDNTSSAYLNGDCPFASEDGITWTVGPPVIVSRAEQWDANVYRPCVFPDPNGTTMHVWYSTLTGTYLCRVGYTRVPRSYWPS